MNAVIAQDRFESIGACGPVTEDKSYECDGATDARRACPAHGGYGREDEEGNEDPAAVAARETHDRIMSGGAATDPDLDEEEEKDICSTPAQWRSCEACWPAYEAELDRRADEARDR